MRDRRWIKNRVIERNKKRKEREREIESAKEKIINTTRHSAVQLEKGKTNCVHSTVYE